MPTANLPALLADPAWVSAFTAQHLPAYLEAQRWYTSKGHEIRSAELEALPWERDDEGLWLLRLSFAAAEAETRVLTVRYAAGEHAADDARVITPVEGGALVDALGDEGFRARLFAFMVEGRSLEGDGGTLVGDGGRALAGRRPEGSELPPQNSSNTVVTYRPEGFLKVFRKTEPGVHPDAELIRYLSDGCDFASVPRYGGGLAYRRAGEDEPMSLALLLGRVDHEGEAWETSLHDVAVYARAWRKAGPDGIAGVGGALDEPLAEGELPAPLAAAMGADALRRIRLLGERTAEMHLHLAAAEAAALRPEALGQGYWDRARTGLRERLHREREYASAETGASLDAIAAWLDAARLPELPAGLIRVHGDYHLGQVLDTGDDVVIIDFEGEPLHSLAYRRARHPAYKDVAGMVRSLHYAPYAYALQEADGADWAMAAAGVWYAAAARLFLTAYRQRAGGAGFLPSAPREAAAALAFFLADKALYELAYERASRPGWLAIPREGLRQVAELLPQ